MFLDRMKFIRRTFSTAATAAALPRAAAPLHSSRRPLRVFSLPGLTDFAYSYILQKRITAHRIAFDKAIDALLLPLLPAPSSSASSSSLLPSPALALSHSERDGLRASIERRKREEEKDADILLLSQPQPVYTMGRNAKLHHVRLQAQPVDCMTAEQAQRILDHPPSSSSSSSSCSSSCHPLLLRLDRGGETTYHGPGQLLCYPLFNLHHTRTDLHHYLRTLEAAIIAALSALSVPALPPCRSDAAYTGVWREGRKLCAIGIGCSRWHTTHGLALNVDVDLQAYDSIVPCGIQEEGRAVGNIRVEVEHGGEQTAHSLQWGDAGMQRAQQAVAEEISHAFGYELQWSEESVESLLARWDAVTVH
jgi:lipoate-protein ligase B